MTQSTNSSLQFEFECPLTSGLHARPASHLAEMARQFSCECTITNLRNKLVANGKSVLGIIAADIRHRDRCTLRFSGVDERAAESALRRFIKSDLAATDVPLAGIATSGSSAIVPRVLRAANVNFIFGTPVSRGIGQGKVLVVQRIALPENLISEDTRAFRSSDPLVELDRIRAAVAAVRRRIGEKLKHASNPVGAAVLQADLAIAGDVFLIEKMNEQVLAGKSAPQAVVEAGKFFIDLLGHSDNEYIRQRSADIEEICFQLLEDVGGASLSSPAIELSLPTVLVAETLAPQQLLQLDCRWLSAIVLENTAATSHATILARSLGIPTLAGVRNARVTMMQGTEILVDADRGFVIPRLSPPVDRFYERERITLSRRDDSRTRHSSKLASTVDGTPVEVAANAASGDEVALAFENGADGIGLFRTEMIFLGRNQAPSEEEQFAIYSQAVRSAGSRPVIIRTFDIGGDKQVPYLNLAHEENPFLGYRGVRMYAEHNALLQSQLRAILRASALGNVQIMAPMIASLEEILQFKAAIADARQTLTANGVPFHPNIKIGIMVEVPAVAFILEQLFPEVDFFSIGTNDLSQYFLAADRGNSKLAPQFTVRHPGFLRFLNQLVDQIHCAGKWVGMCGEMAADVRNLPLLLALGLDEISVPAAEVQEFKRTIAELQTADSPKILRRAISSSTTAEVDNLLRAPQTQQPEPLLSDELVLLGSTSESKEEVIQEMVDAFYVCHRTDDRSLLEEDLWAREAVYSTGLGYGFATPHCKTDAVSADSICVLKLNHSINWDSVDGERVRMVVLLALRNSESANHHMQVFSTLARKLMSDSFRQRLLEIESAHGVTTYLASELGLTVTVLPENPHPTSRSEQSHIS